MLAFFAQIITAPPVEPASGWLNTVLQLGSFGVLCVLIFYTVPKFLDQLRVEREKVDERYADLLEKKEVSFNARNSELLSAIDRHTTKLTDEFRHATEAMEKGISWACRYREVERNASERK